MQLSYDRNTNFIDYHSKEVTQVPEKSKINSTDRLNMLTTHDELDTKRNVTAESGRVGHMALINLGSYGEPRA